jgi:hypothetical protein
LNRRDAAGTVGHEVLGVAQALRRHQTRAAPFAPTCPSGRDPLLDPLTDDVALHLGEGSLNLQEGPAHWSCGVKRGIQRTEADAARLQFVNQTDEFTGEASQAVEVEYDQHVVTAEIIGAGAQARAVAAGAAAAILEDAGAAGRLEGIHLPVEHLHFLSGRDPGVADQLHAFLASLLRLTKTSTTGV